MIAGQTDDAMAPTAPRQGLKPPRWRDGRIITALVIREMGTTYGDSPGGYLWAIIAPVGGVLLLSLGLSMLVRTPALGTSFVLFYATGYLPFDMYTQMENRVSGALRFSRALLAYPGLTWMHAVLSRVILNILTSLSIFCIIIIGILTVVDTRSVIDLTPIMAGLGMTMLFGTSVGMLNCLLGGIFPVWERAWSVATRPLMLASGVLFLFDDLPRGAQAFLWWNPLVHTIAEVRRGFYPTYNADFVSPTYVCGLSLVILVVAVVLLRRYHKRVLEI